MRIYRGLNAITQERMIAIQTGRDVTHPDWTARLDDALDVATADTATRPRGGRYDLIMVGELVTGVIEEDRSVNLRIGGEVRPVGFVSVYSMGPPLARRAELETRLAVQGITNPTRVRRLLDTHERS